MRAIQRMCFMGHDLDEQFQKWLERCGFNNVNIISRQQNYDCLIVVYAVEV